MHWYFPVIWLLFAATIICYIIAERKKRGTFQIFLPFRLDYSIIDL